MSTRYNTIANEFACELRSIRKDFPHTYEAVEIGAWRMIRCWIDLERKVNPRFDDVRFAVYIHERVS